MEDIKSVISRISLTEQYFEKAKNSVEKHGTFAKNIPEINDILAFLSDYLEKDFLSDYELDEKGLLPHDLKRGCLSQDGIFDLLCEAEYKRKDKEMTKPYKKPTVVGEYVNIYKPSADIYKGENTKSFENGKLYEKWLVNDFTVIKGEKSWHLIGITHPKPPTFVDNFNFGDDIHEAEYQLFHACADGESFSDVMKKESFSDCEKILYPHHRDGEPPEIWAPHAAKIGDEYRLFYSPGLIRYATSCDLFDWKPSGVLFDGHSADARDPNLFFDDNGDIYLFFCRQNTICYRKSRDMKEWSDIKLLQTNPFKGGCSESPFMIKKDDIYYLFWCLYDGNEGGYDHRTFVFASKDIDGFDGLAPITMLDAHAPEIVTEKDGATYLLSVFYPENGVNAIKLEWI